MPKWDTSEEVIEGLDGTQPHLFVRYRNSGICAVEGCPADDMDEELPDEAYERALVRAAHPVHVSSPKLVRYNGEYVDQPDGSAKWMCDECVPKCSGPLTHGVLSKPSAIVNTLTPVGGGGSITTSKLSGEPSRVPINIDPFVRAALRIHLQTRYAGTGVGYSEFIRRALEWDQAEGVPEQVQPDVRMPPVKQDASND